MRTEDLRAVRTLIYLPLLLLACTSVGTIVAGILAWGAAENPRYADWIPTFAGVSVGSASLLVAVIALRSVHGRLATTFRIRLPRVLVGMIATTVLIFITAIGSMRVGDSGNYRSYAADNYRIPFSAQDPALAPRFFVISLFVIFPGPIVWLGYGINAFYACGFDPVSSEVEGLDPMGQIMGSA